MEGFRYPEIGKILGMKVSAVAEVMRLAIRKLRENQNDPHERRGGSRKGQ
jgi:DNA-directed RNA polymerase specialized sigma24 family protein